VKLFFATIPYCTFDEDGKMALDYSMNIYECPTFMPLEQTYNILTNEKYGLSDSENISDLDKRLEKLALNDPMARYVYNKYHELTSGIYKYDENGNIWMSDDEQLAKFVNIMKAEVVRSPDIKGTYLLATDDKVLFVGGINSNEADGTTPVNACSTYEIGSVTKTFTAAAVLQLCEQGKLSLDDKLGKFIPEYEKGADVTIYDLLHMRSGISREFFTTEEQTDPELFKKYYNGGFTDEELIAALNKNGLEFEPGSKMQYSNTNYMLLARIIEQVTG
jgi:hypothetical protein